MSRSISGKIKINSFADIVGGDDTAVTEVPLADLHEFKNHPFRVLDDEKIAPDACEKSKISFDTKLTQCDLGVIA